MNSRLLQLADSAFPAGSFAHSAGFEALRQLGRLRGEAALAARLGELAWQTALGALPFLADAHEGSAPDVDRAADAFLVDRVANRASRAQGRAFLLATAAAFDDEGVAALGRSLPCGHAAPAAGAAFGRAGVSLDDARQLFLFGAVRGALSAAVRLGAVGPLRAQALLYRLHPLLDEALRESRGLGAAEACNVAPLVGAAQAAHDRLYSRLFQS